VPAPGQQLKTLAMHLVAAHARNVRARGRFDA
jgi:hypothetical protein